MKLLLTSGGITNPSPRVSGVDAEALGQATGTVVDEVSSHDDVSGVISSEVSRSRGRAELLGKARG
ncbi:hypothetical protein [Sanguibacter sp. Leaf3]|uniref:hypothetical protein n=1 Tax=Sanguibacter sp. Leaf3 TaxID=1736209 RepID=UPI0006FBA189|nr:hypothetical protein [Sanguibacter sp. Leaf3]KQU00225.1 hypothetical protein ASG53_05075 [Sanguibacter sp. Leaf3]